MTQRLNAAGISPSSQRRAIAEYVLFTDEHPSADRVLDRVRAVQPTVSRATVYNTLNLFVEKGLLRQLVIQEGHVVFDPCLAPHHHFLDAETGEISDLPLEAIVVGEAHGLDDYQIEDVQVVIRGRRKATKPARL